MTMKLFKFADSIFINPKYVSSIRLSTDNSILLHLDGRKEYYHFEDGIKANKELKRFLIHFEENY